MNKNTLLSIKDFEPQLNSEQLDTLKNIIYLAQETKKMQGMDIGDKKFIVFPSGKIYEDKKKETCPMCGKALDKKVVGK